MGLVQGVAVLLFDVYIATVAIAVWCDGSYQCVPEVLLSHRPNITEKI